MAIRKSSKKKEEAPVAGLPSELASPEARQETAGAISLLLFETNRKWFAIGVEYTEGVVACPGISPLPSSPDGIIGVASVRGRMTLVMNLGGAVAQQGLKRRLILLRGEAQLGLLADRVEGIMAAKPSRLVKPKAGEHRLEDLKWPVRAIFKGEQGKVPVIDVERLAEI
jgi:chemotaxis signal transduction protein